MESKEEQKVGRNTEETTEILNYDTVHNIMSFLDFGDRINSERVSRQFQSVSLDSWATLKEFKLDDIKRNSCDGVGLKLNAAESVLARLAPSIQKLDF
jgi:hypothetical protein